MKHWHEENNERNNSNAKCNGHRDDNRDGLFYTNIREDLQ